MADPGLNVIALISGGKDSFFSLLHCIEHGHRAVALANLFPVSRGISSQETQVIEPSMSQPVLRKDSTDESDLNSFMYQTVGHEIIPLYAAATGLPLYRQPILGGTERHERDYAFVSNPSKEDETESMTTLLRTIMERHPEANAVCAGAILSTYQRTRVESVALRLGLTPLAYLWQYPTLPSSNLPADDAQLLKDMQATGLDARIIKVASAGLTEAHLWQRASSFEGAEAIKAALRKFGAAGGAVLGEGGEFETLVVDGPMHLFKHSISVPSSGRTAVQEGGGSTWLRIREATLQEKPSQSEDVTVRTPPVLEDRSRIIFDALLGSPAPEAGAVTAKPPVFSSLLGRTARQTKSKQSLLHWTVESNAKHDSIEAETAELVQQIHELLSSTSTHAEKISNTVVLLRRMADFPKVNAQYGQLFAKPNPPSRVTVSCGDLLPSDCNIAIYLTVDTSGGHREGLHVQSRSYWAPANIGPYSQAIGIECGSPGGEANLRSWSVAGQIPLIPGSMLLPSQSETSQQMQIVLSLQHLWRIGMDVKIQFWTSAVALFARSSSEDIMRQNALQAGEAWRLAHGSPEDEDDSDGGVDPWDLKYNSQHMTLAGSTQVSTPPSLPDWSTFTLRQQNEPETCIPPVFAVEVEELPRQAGVEWHAHIGLSHVAESSLEMLHHAQVGVIGWQAWNTVARSNSGLFLYTVVACDLESTKKGLKAVLAEMHTAQRASLRKLNIENISSDSGRPYLTYVDAKHNSWPQPTGEALLPCHSMWSCTGKRLGIIGLYRMSVG